MTNQKLPIKIVVVGATGNIGRKIVDLLLRKNIVPPAQLRLLASHKFADQPMDFGGNQFIIKDAAQFNFKDNNLYLFATDSDVSKYYIPQATSPDTFIVDSSSYYRLDPGVPLIVAPVNKNLVGIDKAHLYAIANCVASPIAIVLAPLHSAFPIKLVRVTTYQSTSGAGKAAMDELYQETKHFLEGTVYHRGHFARQIAFNVIPQIGKCLEDGYTQEEHKIIKELQKILGVDYPITATAVRVPVFIGHSILLSIEFMKDFELKTITEILGNASGIKLSNNAYTTPVEVAGSDDVHVGRIRRDLTVPCGLHLWLCSDNLRRGGAIDVVEVAEELIRQLTG